MSLSGRTAKKRCFRAAPTTATTVEQRRSADVRFGAAALQPFSVLRPFYERRVAFSYGGSTGISSRAKIGRGRRRRRRRQAGREERRKRDENGCSATRIFTRKGVSVIYWKSLPRSCGFVASPREASCEPHLSPGKTRVACTEIESFCKPLYVIN